MKKLRRTADVLHSIIAPLTLGVAVVNNLNAVMDNPLHFGIGVATLGLIGLLTIIQVLRLISSREWKER